MRKILNPYADMADHNCFACSPKNEHGLQMKFVEDGEDVICDWEPKGFLQSYAGILHGGIQATLMDEIGSWLVQAKIGTAGLTSNMNTRFRKSVPINKGKISLRASLKAQRRNLVDVLVYLYAPDGCLCAESQITYFTYPLEVAQKELAYPGPEDFFESVRL